MREKKAKRFRIALPADSIDVDKLTRLKAELEKNPGPLPVGLELEVEGEATADIALPYKVKVTDELIAFADRLFGQKCAELG
jgi:hypothetical protein